MNVDGVCYYMPAWFYADAARWMPDLTVSFAAEQSWRINGRRIQLSPQGWPLKLANETGTITNISVGPASTVITSIKHGLTDGDHIRIRGSNSSPNVDKFVRIAKIDDDNFSIYEYNAQGQLVPVLITTAGNAGDWNFKEVAQGLTLRSNGKHYPGGYYTLKFKGKGTVTLSFWASGRYRNTTGTEMSWSVKVTPDDNSAGVYIQISETDPTDPVRDIHFVMPYYSDNDPYVEDRYVREVFHATFLRRLKPFGVYRFMDTFQTNNNNIVKWEDRTPPDYGTSSRTVFYDGSIVNVERIARTNLFWDNWGDIIRVTTAIPHQLKSGHSITVSGIFSTPYSGCIYVLDGTTFEMRSPNATETPKTTGQWGMKVSSGPQYEVGIKLCNRLWRDMWICVPALADDNYVRQLATIIKRNLYKQLKVYIEYSNEVWNGMFTQYAVAKGYAASLGYSPDCNKGYAERSKRVFDIFYEVFGDQAPQRLVRLVASQAVNSWHMGRITSYMDGKFDAISCATYFGPESGFTWSATTTADQVMDSVIRALDSGVFTTKIKAYADITKDYSTRLGRKIQLLAYEGGIGVMAPKDYLAVGWETQVHPKIVDAYNKWFKIQEDLGFDVSCPYAYVGNWAQWGLWGHLHYQDDWVTLARAPKYKMVYDYALKNNG